MPDDLYRKDIVRWAEAQVERLRRVADGERVNDVDWENVIEEIESEGRSETTAAESFLRLALLHALKVIAWPGHTAGRKWRNEIANVLAEARQRFAPSMVQSIHLPAVHRAALRQLRGLDMRVAPVPVPASTDMTVAEVLDEDLTPEALIARLRAG